MFGIDYLDFQFGSPNQQLAILFALPSLLSLEIQDSISGFHGNFALVVGLNRRNNRRNYWDYGKEMFRDGIGCVRIRVWNCTALERWHGYD